jgi:hypothetical protein
MHYLPAPQSGFGIGRVLDDGPNELDALRTERDLTARSPRLLFNGVEGPRGGRELGFYLLVFASQ